MRVSRGASIQPGGTTPFCLPADDLTGVMMGNPPDAVFADKKVARRECAALEFLFAQHQGGVAVYKGLFVEAGDARRPGVRQDTGPALDNRIPVLERRPCRVKTGDRHVLRP